MTSKKPQHEQEAIGALKSLGCREYEAECFVALCRLPSATAKEVSEVTDIPRTRVYDAMEALSEKGLVEIHYASPKRYRAVDLSQALAWFREKYRNQISTFEGAVQSLPSLEPEQIDCTQTVWSLRGVEAILIRVKNMVEAADSYVAVFVDDTDQFDRQVLELLNTVTQPRKYVLSPPQVDSSFLTECVGTDGVEFLDVALPLASPTGQHQNDRPITCVVSDGEALLLRTRSTGCKGIVSEDHAVVAEGADNSLLVWFQLLFGL